MDIQKWLKTPSKVSSVKSDTKPTPPDVVVGEGADCGANLPVYSLYGIVFLASIF